MTIGLISDIHDDLEALDQAFQVFVENGVEMLIFCGDFVRPDTLRYFGQKAKDHRMVVKAVLGNNETDSEAKEIRTIIENDEYPIDMSDDLYDLTFEIDGREYAVCHGHDALLLEALTEDEDFAVVFRGHTHKPADYQTVATRVINPGAVCRITMGQPTSNRGVAIFDSETQLVRFISLEQS